MLTDITAICTARGKRLAAPALVAALLLGGCDGGPGDLRAESSQRIERAQAYHKQGQYRAAMIEARNAIKLAPELAEPHIALARIFNTLAQGKQALTQLDQIPAPQRNGSAYQATLVQAYLHQDKYRSALNALAQSEALRREKPSEYYLLHGGALMGAGDIEAAADSYRQALATEPEHQQALLGLARIRSRDNAIEPSPALQKLEQLYPRSAEVLMLKAGIAFNQNQLDETEHLLTQALTALPSTDIMTPQRASVLRALADILVRQGHSAEALIYTRLLAEAFPGADEANSRYRQALELFRQKEFAAAESNLEQLLDEYPRMGQAAQLLGIIKFIKGDLQQANQYFSEYLDPEIAPQAMTRIAALTNMRLREPDKVLELLQDQVADDSDPQMLAMYGIAALAAGQFERGEAALLRAVKADPALTRLRLALANYYNGKQPPQPEQALTQLKIALNQNDGDPLIQAALVRYYLQSEQQAEALKLITTILRKDPQAHTGHILAGDYYRAVGKLSQAVSHYQKAVTLNAEEPRSLLRLGQAQLALKDHAAAKRTYQQVIERAPEEKSGYQGLIAAHELAGDAEAAIDTITRLSRTGTHQVPATVLAEHYARRNNFEQAGIFEQAVIDAAPNARSTSALTGAIAHTETQYRLRQGEFALARQAAHRGLAANPGSVPLLRALSQTEIMGANYGEAEKIIAQVRTANPAVADHLTGDLQRAQGNIAAAIDAYESAWETAPSDLLGSKIYALRKTGEPTRASSFLAAWLAAYPDNIRAITLRSEEKIARADFNAAISDLQRVLEVQPNSPALLNNLAWAYYKTGNPEAVATARKAYELAPDNAAIADTYGWVLFKNGDRRTALDILRKAAALAPENQEIREHLKAAQAGG
ncbi:tetratricopeptide repeat protein [Exilibacterium tricleocarpae]|uniref:Tetratricopeptide repeat protein n=1 Tax=Exilibacterium tricleocarpae TaxID=2591008 RepID=A0A545T3E7_9GAMM|nr:tetratricopeptide repeat protein [Exilibacterium tricleocarpae]TQV71743.1 tetratricopeptide repeat protein [Exilibacterium tricleocarpae]